MRLKEGNKTFLKIKKNSVGLKRGFFFVFKNDPTGGREADRRRAVNVPF
jgi:hypothetical protein